MTDTAAVKQLRELYEGIRDERRMYSNTATRIGDAFLALLSYINDDAPFLRRDREDSTNFVLNLLAGCIIGKSANITLNPDGSITCGSIKVEGSAIFDEIIFNRQNALEGDTYFTDKAIVETVEHSDVNQYKLTFRKQYDNDFVSFHRYDILRCSVNNLDRDRTFRTSWMRVDSVDVASNSCVVTMYDGKDVPGGLNFPPSPAACVIRWGNQSDKERQQIFFISSIDGRFLFLQGVDKPIIDDTNYSAFVGCPPDLDIFKDLALDKKQPYVYTRGLIVQDLIQLDYKGQPVYTIRDRGQWRQDELYFHDAIRSDTGEILGYFTDRVWYGGCYWECAVAVAAIGVPPKYNNADWMCLIGNGDFSMEIESTNGIFFKVGAYFSTTLRAHVKHGETYIEEKDIGRNNITWTRISDDTAGDEAWNIKHKPGSCGLWLPINSDEDVPADWNGSSSLAFQCEVDLNVEKLVAIFEI